MCLTLADLFWTNQVLDNINCDVKFTSNENDLFLFLL